MNPRRIATRRGPKRLKNLPPGLRRYWQRMRATGRRAIANPRRAKRRRNPPRGFSMASRPRRRRRHHRLSAHMRRVRAGRKAARTRARRRNVVALANPRRRMRRHRYHSRAYRRNPRRAGRMGGLGSLRGAKSLAIGAGIGAVGAVGLDYVWQWLSGNLLTSYPQLQTGYVGTGVKAGVALLAGWGASKVVGKQTAIGLAGGALTVIAYQLLHQMISSAAPAAAIPATTTAATPALQAYMPNSMAAYMPHSMAGLGWTSPGTPLRGLGRMGAGRWNPVSPPRVPALRPGGSVSASGLASPGSWG